MGGSPGPGRGFLPTLRYSSGTCFSGSCRRPTCLFWEWIWHSTLVFLWVTLSFTVSCLLSAPFPFSWCTWAWDRIFLFCQPIVMNDLTLSIAWVSTTMAISWSWGVSDSLLSCTLSWKIPTSQSMNHFILQFYELIVRMGVYVRSVMLHTQSMGIFQGPNSSSGKSGSHHGPTTRHGFGLTLFGACGRLGLRISPSSKWVYMETDPFPWTNRYSTLAMSAQDLLEQKTQNNEARS